MRALATLEGWLDKGVATIDARIQALEEDLRRLRAARAGLDGVVASLRDDGPKADSQARGRRGDKQARLLDVLVREPAPATAAALATRVGWSYGATRTALVRLGRRGLVTQRGNKWAARKGASDGQA